MEKHLHIICHDIPWPANYGGVIDCFNMISSLHQEGVLIHLHCFQYGGRTITPELEGLCHKVYCYPRRKRFSLRLPYIISSRQSPELMNRLLEDDYPILMYGLHSTWPVMDSRFAGRKMAMRLINVEWQYYRGLAQSSRNWRRLYYWAESRLLRRYEAQIGGRAPILAISAADAEYFKIQPGAGVADYLPAFVAAGKPELPDGKGSFCLYHGNLSVPENETAARWLLQSVFSQLNIPLVIAGKRPSKKLEHLAHSYPNACIAASPSDREMKDLIGRAQINILPSVNETGMKLKVLESLQWGRFCIVNDKARNGFQENRLVITANNAAAMQEAVMQWYDQPFTTQNQEERRRLLEQEFNNSRNVQRLISYLW